MARFNPRTKKAALKFLQKYNAKHGSGGILAAARKYKVSHVSLIKWGKDAGVIKGRKGKTRKAKTVRKAAKVLRARAPKNTALKLQVKKIALLQTQIQKRLNKLAKAFKKLSKAI